MNVGDFFGNYGPLIATGVGALVGGKGQQTPAQTLNNAPPEIRALLASALSQYQRAQPMRDATQNLSYGLLPTWARPTQTLPTSSPATPESSALTSAINSRLSPSGGGGGQALNKALTIASTAAPFVAKAAAGSSVLPALGAAAPFALPIGAGAAIYAAIKRHQNATKGDRESFARDAGFADLASFNNYLSTLGPLGQQARDYGENVVGKHNTGQQQQWFQMIQNAISQGGR